MGRFNCAASQVALESVSGSRWGSVAKRTSPLTKLRRMMRARSEEHTSELQSQSNLVCRLLLEKKKYDDLSVKTILRRMSQSTRSKHRPDETTTETKDTKEKTACNKGSHPLSCNPA